MLEPYIIDKIRREELDRQERESVGIRIDVPEMPIEIRNLTESPTPSTEDFGWIVDFTV